MTAVNHALAGSVIGALVANPFAWPLAFVSHFALDALPHFGNDKNLPLSSRPFWTMLTVDALLVLLLVGLIGSDANQPEILLVAAGLAVLPDLAHLNLVSARRLMPTGRLYRFHQRVQWSESPKGMILEAFWFFTMTFVLLRLIDG